MEDGERRLDDGGANPPHEAFREGGPTGGSDAGRDTGNGYAGSSPALPTKLYIIGRRDLPPGLRAAQLTHAGIAWAALHGEPPDNLVLLEAADAAQLDALWGIHKALGKRAVAFYEPDLGDARTAFALESDGRELSSLPLAFRRV